MHILILVVWLVSPWIHSLTLQYMKCKYDLLLSYLELHKGFIFCRKKIGRIALVRFYPYWTIRENHLNLALVSEIHKNTSRWIVDLWMGAKANSPRNVIKAHWAAPQPMLGAVGAYLWSSPPLLFDVALPHWLPRSVPSDLADAPCREAPWLPPINSRGVRKETPQVESQTHFSLA